MSAITQDASAPREEEGPHFEPVVRLTEQIDVKTNEEDEDVKYKIRAKLFRFASESNEWKEKGTGEVRLLQHKESKKIRLVMRRDKTYKVCANHLISLDMKLQPNVGSDRSWVWKVAADYSEEPPTSETLAIRFANSEFAEQFKVAFEESQKTNVGLSSTPQGSDPAPVESESEGKEEIKEKEKIREETEATEEANEGTKE